MSVAWLRLNWCCGSVRVSVCVAVHVNCCAVVIVSLVMSVGGVSVVSSGVSGLASILLSSRRLIHRSSQPIIAALSLMIQLILRLMCGAAAACTFCVCCRACVHVIVFRCACAFCVNGACVECDCLMCEFRCCCMDCVRCCMAVLCCCVVIDLIAVNPFSSERSITLCDGASQLCSSASSLLLNQLAASNTRAHCCHPSALCICKSELFSSSSVLYWLSGFVIRWVSTTRFSVADGQ